MAITLQKATLLMERLKSLHTDGLPKEQPLASFRAFFSNFDSDDAHNVFNFLYQLSLDGEHIHAFFERKLQEIPELHSYGFTWSGNGVFLTPNSILSQGIGAVPSTVIWIDFFDGTYYHRTDDVMHRFDPELVQFPERRKFFGLENDLERDLVLMCRQYLQKPSFKNRIKLFQTAYQHEKKHALRQLFLSLTLPHTTMQRVCRRNDDAIKDYEHECKRCEEAKAFRQTWCEESKQPFLDQINATIALLEKNGFELLPIEYWS